MRVLKLWRSQSFLKKHDSRLKWKIRNSHQLTRWESTVISAIINESHLKNRRHNFLILSSYVVYRIRVVTFSVRWTQMSSIRPDNAEISVINTINWSQSANLWLKKQFCFRNRSTFAMKGIICCRLKRSTLRRCWKRRIRSLIGCRERRVCSNWREKHRWSISKGTKTKSNHLKSIWVKWSKGIMLYRSR